MESTKVQFKTIDEYINTFPNNVQAILQKLRQTIKTAVPEATETISYNMPTFNLNDEYLVYFSAWQSHIAIYALSTGENAITKELNKYATLKGTLKFPLDEPFPYDLIVQAVKQRAKEMLEK